MKSLKPISLSGAQVRGLCVPGIRNADRRARILADENNILVEEAQFRAAVAKGTQRALIPKDFDETIKKDMKWLYDTRFVSHDSGRSVWSEILALSKGRCPFCHIALATTVDHSFPKSVHPRLAVDPLNLVPACRDCNLDRGTGRSKMSISPYIDTWAATTPWLTAAVLEPARPEDLKFEPKRHPNLSDDQWESLTEFFEDTSLSDRYSDCAIDEFLPFAQEMRTNFDSPTLADIQGELHARMTSRNLQLGPNRWQTAAYSAWLQSSHLIDWGEAGKL